jgi:hypothetical protein
LNPPLDGGDFYEFVDSLSAISQVSSTHPTALKRSREMANFIVTYDLNGPYPSHQDVDQLLSNLGGTRVLETVWWVPWSGDHVGLRDRLMSTLRSEDGLIVCEVSAAAWNGILVDSNAFRTAFEQAA